MKLYLVLIAAVFFLTRLWHLLDFPVFCDETFYLALAEKIRINPKEFLLPLSTATQPLFIWLVALANVFIKDLILAGRLASVLIGFFNLLILYKLLNKLGFKKARFLAVLFFLFSPFILTYNRLAMLEGLSLLGITLGVYGAVCLSFSPNLLHSLLFGVLISLGILTKATGFFAYPLSFLIFLLALREKRKKRKIVSFFMIGWLTSFLIYFFLSLAAVGSFSQVSWQNFLRPSGHLVKSSFLDFARIKNNFWRGFLWLRQYFTTPFFWLFVASSFFALVKRSRKELFFIAWFFLVFCFEIIVARTFFPRYLFPLTIPVVVLPAIFLSSLFKNLKLSLITGLIFLIPAFLFDYQVIFTPEKAPWPGEDRFQFFEDWTSGAGFEKIALFLRREAEAKKIVVFVETNDSAFVILRYNPLLKGHKILFVEEEALRNPIKVKPERLFKNYPRQEKYIATQYKQSLIFASSNNGVTAKYIIRSCHQNLPKNWPVKLVREVSKNHAACKIRVYQVLDDKLKY